MVHYHDIIVILLLVASVCLIILAIILVTILREQRPLASRIVLTFISKGKRMSPLILGGPVQNETLDVGKSYKVVATPVDGTGTTQPVAPGSFTFTLDNTTLASFSQDAGGVGSGVLAVHAAGTFNLTANCNADPSGATQVPINGVAACTAVVVPPPPKATTITMSFTAQ